MVLSLQTAQLDPFADCRSEIVAWDYCVSLRCSGRWRFGCLMIWFWCS